MSWLVLIISSIALGFIVAASFLRQRFQRDLSAARVEIEEQQQQMDSIIAEARTDPLTGLANRRALDEELVRLFSLKQRKGVTFTLLMFDVDHFKSFNDQHGHQIGDQVLQILARNLKSTLPDMDLVARYGGEEFAVILPGTFLKDAVCVGERIRKLPDLKSVGTECFPDDQCELPITVSYGAAEVIDGEIQDEFLERADQALYAAKQAGRDRGFIHDGQESKPVSSASVSAS